MRHPKITQAIMNLVPDIEMSIDDDNFDFITVHSGHTLPTLSQVIIELARLDLEDAKSDKRDEVNTLRDEKSSSLFTHGGRTFDADVNSQLAINHAISYGREANINDVTTRDWTKADDVTTTMTWGEFRAMAITLFERAGALHSDARAHKDAINLMVDIPTIEAYDVTTGWAV